MQGATATLGKVLAPPNEIVASVFGIQTHVNAIASLPIASVISINHVRP